MPLLEPSRGVQAPRPAGRAAQPSASDRSWDLLLVATAGYMLTAVGRIHQLIPGLEMLQPALLTAVIASGLSLSDTSALRRWHHLLVPTTKAILALLIWMTLSIPFALSAGVSFAMVVDNFAKTVLMYCVIAAAVRGVADVRRLTFVYFLAAAIYSAVVIVQFDVSATAWRLARLYYYDANDFATFAVTDLPFGLHFLRAGRRPLVRVLGAAGIVLLVLGIVRSGSRGGFLALIAVAAVVVVRWSSFPLRWRVCSTLLVALVVVGTASDRYWEQMTTITSDSDYNVTEEAGRLNIWKRGVGYMLQNPVLGVGAGNFGTAEGTLSPFASRAQYGIGVRWSAAHNSLIQVGAELGVPGLAFFVAVIVTTFRAFRRRRDRAPAPAPDEAVDLRQAFAASLVGFMVGAFFLSLAYAEMLYTIAALVVGLAKVTGERPPART